MSDESGTDDGPSPWDGATERSQTGWAAEALGAYARPASAASSAPLDRASDGVVDALGNAGGEARGGDADGIAPDTEGDAGTDAHTDTDGDGDTDRDGTDGDGDGTDGDGVGTDRDGTDGDGDGTDGDGDTDGAWLDLDALDDDHVPLPLDPAHPQPPSHAERTRDVRPATSRDVVVDAFHPAPGDRAHAQVAPARMAESASGRRSTSAGSGVPGASAAGTDDREAAEAGTRFMPLLFAAIATVVAAFIHPLAGLIAGAVILGASVLSFFAHRGAQRSLRLLPMISSTLAVAISIASLAIAASPNGDDRPLLGDSAAPATPGVAQEYRGSGDDTISITLPDGDGRPAAIEVVADGGYASVTERSRSGDDDRYLGSTMGGSGRFVALVNDAEDWTTGSLKISGSGSWTVIVSSIASLPELESWASGVGPVLLRYEGPEAMLTMSFAPAADVDATLGATDDYWSVYGHDLYGLSKLLPAGPSVIILETSASWTLELKPVPTSTAIESDSPAPTASPGPTSSTDPTSSTGWGGPSIPTPPPLPTVAPVPTIWLPPDYPVPTGTSLWG